ncbi:hypothetical protein Tco_1370560 [Tanacetum coccineum]
MNDGSQSMHREIRCELVNSGYGGSRCSAIINPNMDVKRSECLPRSMESSTAKSSELNKKAHICRKFCVLGNKVPREVNVRRLQAGVFGQSSELLYNDNVIANMLYLKKKFVYFINAEPLDENFRA